MGSINIFFIPTSDYHVYYSQIQEIQYKRLHVGLFSQFHG